LCIGTSRFQELSKHGELMADSQGILLFGNDSSAGSASSDYDKDAFQDISLPASNNTGFTSTLSTNPLNGFYANDGAPKWMAKTLFIKDLQRVEDRTLWVNGRATYKIIWHEDFPGADGYVFGAITLSGTAESRIVSINDAGDGCGVSGVIRRVQWLVRPRSGTATATPSLDGSNLTAIDFGGYTNLGNAFTTTKPMFEAFTTNSVNADRNIHTHQLVADQTNQLQIIGVVVYYNVAGDGLDLFGGIGYVDKSRTSYSGSTLAYPLGLSNFLGGWDGVFVNSNGQFSATLSPVPGIAAPCSGAINTNLLSVQIGSGASFPIGTGIYIPNGATYYLGAVTNVSGDVLTVGPTLASGLSNVCSALFNAGPSFAISASLFTQSFSWQAGVGAATLGSSLIPSQAPFSFSDPYLRYRAWGSTLQLLNGASQAVGLGQSLGLRFPTTSDFFRFEGRFSALEFEYLIGTSAILLGTYTSDALVNTGVSTALNGPTVLRQTVMTNAGMGWHSVEFRNSGSTNVFLSRVTGYEPKVYQGPSYGLLAQVCVGQTFTLRDAQNATLMAFGDVTRVYAESLRASGSGWTSIAELGPGGRSIFSAVDGDFVEFQYFGSRFALLGSAGTSSIIAINGGGATTPAFNTWSTAGSTLGFNTVRVTSKAGTLKLFGYDFLSPVGEVRNKQTVDAVPNQSITPRVWVQPSEPLSARTGDIWQVDSQGIAYQRLYGGWQRIVRPVNIVTTAAATLNTSGTTPFEVTRLTIQTTGRPVRVYVRGSSSVSYWRLQRGSSNTTDSTVRLSRNGVVVALVELFINTNATALGSNLLIDYLPNVIDITDNVGPGAFTYVLEAAGGSASDVINWNNIQLEAIEL
jgi:hypothetical protein